MKQLLVDYNQLKQVSLDDVLNFHVQFERIHPFLDGNGRIGRLLMFWQCLQNNIVPFIITEEQWNSGTAIFYNLPVRGCIYYRK